MTDDQIAAFDFPLRYKLKEVCDTPNYDLRKLTDGESISAGRPFNAVTFTENHDMGGDEVVNDKMLGYSFTTRTSMLWGSDRIAFLRFFAELRPNAPPYKGVTGEPHIRNPSISVPSLIRTTALSSIKRSDGSASRKNS